MTRENDKLYTIEEVWTGYQKYLEEQKLGDPEKITSFFRFPEGYIPNLQFITQPSGKKDIFIDTIGKTFEVEGAKAIRYILMYANGTCYDHDPETGKPGEDIDLRLRQLFPGSFIAKVSCSMRAMTPSQLVLDYVLDTSAIPLEGIVDSNGNAMTMIRNIDLNHEYRRPSTGDIVYFDEWIQTFLAHRNTIFDSYFAPRFLKDKPEDR